jgi:hypothetical protein
MLAFFSVSLLFGLAQLARLVLGPLIARLRLPAGLPGGLGRAAALGGILALAGAVFVQSYREFASVPRSFFAPLGLYVEASYADELSALADLKDQPAIATRAPEDRIFSAYLSAAEQLLDAHPATRFGSVIHALGDAARAEYLAQSMRTAYPLVALTAPTGRLGHWHDWNLRANWYLYAPILARYDPAFRTRYMMFLVPRAAPAVPPADLPALRCEIRATGPGTVELVIADDSGAGDVHFGADWLIDVTLAQVSAMAPRPFPESLLPLIGTRGMLAVDDRSSTYMARDYGDNPVPAALLGPDGGFLHGLPIGPGDRSIPAEHRFGTPSRIDLTAMPKTRATLAVDSCTPTPIRPNPFADAEAAFPLVSDIDAAARLAPRDRRIRSDLAEP